MNPEQLDEIKVVKKKGKLKSHILLIARTDAEGKIRYEAGYGWKKAGAIQTLQQWEEYLKAASGEL